MGDPILPGPLATELAPFPIAVCIPTYNRSDALFTCLQHLEQQTWHDFEVIIVDDGSTDDTPQRLEAYLAQSPLRIRTVRQSNAGPARARNLAVTLATAPVVLFIGDDIFCSPHFVATHLNFHRAHPAPHMAALGLTHWSETAQTVTPFMHWLDTTGLQFSYDKMLAGKKPAWGEFFTSNLSLKTRLLLDNPFNETFPAAAMEDIELGYRLERFHGLQIEFLPDALAWHLHPTTFLSSCRRLYGVGRSTFLFNALWPELSTDAPSTARQSLGSLFHRMPWTLSILTRLTDLLTRAWCPNPLLERVLRMHAAAGYRAEAASRKSASAGL